VAIGDEAGVVHDKTPALVEVRTWSSAGAEAGRV
jgi:hypothetical protein